MANRKPSLGSQLKNLISKKKVLVLIDGANLYFAAYKKKLAINFEKLLNWFQKNSNLTESIYYTAFNSEDLKQTEFLKNLEKVGYKLNKKELQVFSDDTKKGNLDVEICVDALLKNKEYEILVLVSGDGDFAYLVENLEVLGKKVIVLGVGGFVSFNLHQVADNYFFLDRITEVWKTNKKDKKETNAPQIFIEETNQKSESREIKKVISKKAVKPLKKSTSKGKISIKRKIPKQKNLESAKILIDS